MHTRLVANFRTQKRKQNNPKPISNEREGAKIFINFVIRRYRKCLMKMFIRILTSEPFSDNSATSFLSPSSGAGGGAVPVSAVHSTHSDLIYDSINMSQVQNYSPSLSSSLGELLSNTFGNVKTAVVVVECVFFLFLEFII